VHAGLRHPLMGARLSTLLGSWARNGLPAPRYWPLVAAMVGFAAVRAPVSLLERRELRRRRAGAMPPPVFVIGHWRSGTTHLHNLLSCNPTFGHISPLASGLPDQLLTLATWLRPWLEKALPEDRHVDRVAVTPESPQEDEIPLANQQPVSIFHALYQPRRFRELARRGVFFEGCTPAEIERWARAQRAFLEKVSVHQGGRPVLVKNPVYTGRLARLRALWPEARFIHIHRNPYEVFASTRHYYRKMLEELALQPYAHVDVEAFVLETYADLMGRYDTEAPALPPDRLVDVSFEALEREPLATLEHVHATLGLEGWSAAAPHVRRYLDDLRGYTKNQLRYPEADLARVEAAWAPWVARWGTGRPGSP
jgi:hypothetical protein